MINDEDEILYHIYDIQQIKKNTYDIMYDIMYGMIHIMYHKKIMIQHTTRIPYTLITLTSKMVITLLYLLFFIILFILFLTSSSYGLSVTF